MQTKSLSAPPIDLERLLKLRLAVARFGEMDMPQAAPTPKRARKAKAHES